MAWDQRLVGVLALVTVGCGTPYMPLRTPPELVQPDGTRHEQGQFDGVGGAHLYWQSWQPTLVPKKGALVVMHGLKDHSSRYAELGARLNHDGYAVYAFDMRGHGYSEGDRVGVELFDDYVKDFDIFLYRVRLVESGLPVFVFGHSMGGAIVTLHAIEYQPDVRGMITSGAALEPGVSGAKIALTNLTASLNPSLDVFNLDLEKFSRDPAVVKAAQDDPLVYQGAATAHMASELLGGIRRIDENMERVMVPLLILHGKMDEVTPPSGSQELYDRARAPDRTLTLYGNMVHDLVHEPEKAVVMDQIAAWMNLRAR